MLLNIHYIFLFIFLFSFIGTSIVSFATETDIACLRSIKGSLEDPNNYLSPTWNFDNNTEGYFCKFLGVECWHFGENRVLNLRLGDLGLKGPFPPGLRYCTSLTGLDLSNNELSGPLPSNISHILGFLTTLDLSFNQFSGVIPDEIANCTYLNSLKLDHNKFRGQIPPAIGSLGRLKTFSFANNLLEGPVPYFYNASISSDSYAHNLGLCGKPLEDCSSFRPHGFRDGFLIGYLVFSVSVIVIFMSYCVPWVHVQNRNEMVTIAKMVILWLLSKNNKTKANEQDSPTSAIKDYETKQITVLEEKVSRIGYEDLCSSTNDFNEDNIIGLGKKGIVYKATLPDGCVIAVKKLFDSCSIEEQFIAELKTTGTLRHVNLLPLMGFCITLEERFLVYKYMPNGNLYQQLHMTEGEPKSMEWPLRRKIGIGVARGLAWLHHECIVRVIHLDISSKCVLLDQNFEPKISNFGEAMLIKRNVMNATDSCYVNGEFWETAFLKEDVYSFGVLLLELITGKDCGKMPTSSSNCNGGSRNEWISHILDSSTSFYEMIDRSLVGRGFDAEIFRSLEIAINCVHSNPEQRPTMYEVHEHMKAVRGERVPA